MSERTIIKAEDFRYVRRFRGPGWAGTVGVENPVVLTALRIAERVMTPGFLAEQIEACGTTDPHVLAGWLQAALTTEDQA